MHTPDLYFSDLFENTNDLIQYVSKEGAIEKVNPAWLSTLGYNLDEVINQPLTDFIISYKSEHFGCKD